MSDMKDPFEREDLEDSLNDLTNDQEDHKEEVVSEQPEEVAAEQQPEVVEKAKKTGYLTKEEYQAKYGTLEGFKTPDQFVKYGEAWNEVKDVIKNMQKQLGDRDKQIEALVKYQERTEERALQKVKVNLDAQLREAKQVGDVESIEKLIREKQKLEFQEAQQQQQRIEVERQNAAKAFEERNKHWYNINPIVTERAKLIDQEIRAYAQTYNIPLTYDQLAHQVEARLRLEFPDVVGISPHIAPSISPSRSASNKSSPASMGAEPEDRVFNNLDEEYKSIYVATKRMLEKQGKSYSKKEFINRLKKDGEI